MELVVGKLDAEVGCVTMTISCLIENHSHLELSQVVPVIYMFKKSNILFKLDETIFNGNSPVVYKNVQLGLLAFGSEIVTFSWLKRKEKYESKMHVLLSHVFKRHFVQPWRMLATAFAKADLGLISLATVPIEFRL